MNRDVNRISKWFHFWGVNLNASKSKTLIVSRSPTSHHQSTTFTLDGIVLKASDDLVILDMTFDAKMTVEKHVHCVCRAATQ